MPCSKADIFFCPDIDDLFILQFFQVVRLCAIVDNINLLCNCFCGMLYNRTYRISYIFFIIKCYDGNLNICHDDPFPVSTTPTVLNNIFISSPMDQLAMYCVSKATTSSKFLMSLLPLTCHIPVNPGLMPSLAL